MAEVFGLTKAKTRRLRDLYAAWQSMTRTPSTYRELRNRFPYLDSRYARAASFNIPSRKEPLHLPKDMFRIVNVDGRFAHFFLRIPTEARNYLWLPLRMNRHLEEIVHGGDYGDSKLIRRGDRFFLHLTVKRQAKTMEPSSLLGVDLGERNLATAVLWQRSQVNLLRWFYGREARGIRRHYAWLRKRLGERKLQREVKRISGKEQKAINNLCHNVSREIVNTARKQNSAIILGDLKGIRARARGRRMNRIVSNMPYLKLSRFIEYKAAWEGIPVITTSEAYTSRTCPRCGSEGRRPKQGLFQCSACGFEANADYVGARNLTERAARWFAAGALRVQAHEGDMTCDESPQLSQQPKT